MQWKSTIERETIFGMDEIILSRMKFLYGGSSLLVQCIILKNTKRISNHFNQLFLEGA